MALPEVRLFVSVDIAGSTALKNRQNYSYLVKLHQENKKLLKSAKERLLGISGAGLSAIDIDRVHEDVLLAHLPSEEDLDWAAMLQQCFSDFHSIFRRYLGAGKEPTGENTWAVDDHDFYPWKALGDELIYSFRVTRRKQIQSILTHFIAALREYDEKLSVKDRIRLKSSAWVAGFPIRNRKIKLPMAKLRLDQEGDNAVEYPYPGTDYLGPDMDTGFRLGRCTWPSVCVVSVELAQFLGECESTSQIRLRHVGWEKLKGVWEDRPYPIFWAALPPEHPLSRGYNEIKTWSEGESEFIRAWKQESPREAKEFLPLIRDLRDQLPPELGIVKPYINAEGDAIPEIHGSITKILQEHKRGVEGQQTTTDGAGDTGSGAPDSSVVQKLVDEKLKPIDVALTQETPAETEPIESHH